MWILNFPLVYYLAEHKTTGARGWMSILGFLLLVYAPQTVLQNITSTTKGPPRDNRKTVIFRMNYYYVFHFLW